MKTLSNCAKNGKIWLALALLLSLARSASAADVHFDVLHFKTEAITNATVIGVSKTDICVTHPGGLQSIKIKDLDEETLYRLGLGPRPAGYVESGTPKSESNSTSTAAATVSDKRIRTLKDFERKLPFKMPATLPPKPVLIGFASGFVLIYLFIAFCLKLTIEKTGKAPGMLIWVPVLQLIPMLQAAGMSMWWLLGFCIPIFAIVPQIMWCIKIVKARGKNVWLALLLILPITNFFTLMYLAFSSANTDEEADQPRPVFGSPSFKEA